MSIYKSSLTAQEIEDSMLFAKSLEENDAIRTTTPIIIPSAVESDEGNVVNVVISNYDANNKYSVSVDLGTYVITGNTVTWTLPLVDNDINVSMTVFSLESGSTLSEGARVFLTIKNIPYTEDSSISYDGVSMSEFTNLYGTEVISGDLHTTKNVSLTITNNKPVIENSLGFLTPGDRILLNENPYNIDTVLETDFDGESFSTVTQTGSSNILSGAMYGIDMAEDGSKIYFVEYPNNKIGYHELGTNFDLSTLGVKHVFSYTGPTSIVWSADGTQLTILSSGNIRQHTASTPWSYESIDGGVDKSVTFSGAPYGADWNADATELIVGTPTGIFVYETSTAYDISNLVINNDKTYTLSTHHAYNNVYDMAMSSDGKRFTVLDYGNVNVVELTASTPFDPSTITSANVVSVSSFVSSDVSGLAITRDGKHAYLMNYASDELVGIEPPNSLIDYKTTTLLNTTPIIPATVTSAELITKRAISNVITQDIGDTNFSGVKNCTLVHYPEDILQSSSVGEVSTSNKILSGDKLVVDFITSQEIITVDSFTTGVTTPNDATNIVYDGGRTDLVTSETSLEFSLDGTKAYVSDVSGGLKQYSCGTPFSINTATFDSVSLTPGDVKYSHFTEDGLILLVCVEYTGIYQYSLSTAWDISTATLDGSVQPADTSKAFRSAVFVDNGTKVMTSRAQYGFEVYSLTTPYDVTTLDVVVSNKLTASSILSIDCNNNGTVVIISEISSLELFTLSTPYDLSTAVLFDTITSLPVTGGCTFSRDGRHISAGKASNNLGTSSLPVGETFNVYDKYTIDISGINNIDNADSMYSLNTKVLFDFGNGNIEASGRVDTINSRAPLTVTSTYDDVIDGTGGRTLTSSIYINDKNTIIESLSGIILKPN